MKREKVTRATMQPLQIQREGLLLIFNMVVRWRWVDGEGETGETKNDGRCESESSDGHGPTIELTPLVGTCNKRMFLKSQTWCLVKRVGNWKSTCALFGLNVDPTQNASAHSFMLLSWISNSPGTGNWINEWKYHCVFKVSCICTEPGHRHVCWPLLLHRNQSMYLVHAMY